MIEDSLRFQTILCVVICVIILNHFFFTKIIHDLRSKLIIV